MTSFEQFRQLSKAGNVIPIYETLFADTETPVSVYLKIQKESPYSFLLESVEGGEHLGRYSFIGFSPFMSFSIRDKHFALEVFHDDVKVLPTLVSQQDHPLTALRKIFRHIKTVGSPGLPRLSGGAVGYFGYESVQLVEDVPTGERDGFDIPDALLLFYDVVLVFDNLKHQIFLVSNAYLPADDRSERTLRLEYEKASAEIERLKKLLNGVVSTEIGGARLEGPLNRLTSKEEYCRSVERSRTYIAEGDIFQVVLSQRLEQKAVVAPFDLYRSLRVINPSPYMYFLNYR